MKDVFTNTRKNFIAGKGKTDLREFLPKGAFVTNVKNHDVEELDNQGEVKISPRVLVEYALNGKDFRISLSRSGKQWMGVSL